MMTSPYTFYKENIEGKSIKEINNEIACIKIQIKKLKSQITKPTNSITTCPTPHTTIKIYKQYLQQAEMELIKLTCPK